MVEGDPLEAARTFLAERRFKEAEAAAREELRLDPYSVDAYLIVASALTGQGRPGEARIAAERAIALDPGQLDGHIAYASALIADRRGAEAETAARRAVSVAPDSADAHMVLGHALALQGRRADADREFDLAVGLEPADEEGERLWKRWRAPVVLAVTVAGLLAYHALQALTRRFTFETVAVVLLFVTAGLIVAVLVGLAIQRRRVARMTASERLELAVEARRRRRQDLADNLFHALVVAVVIGGLSAVTLLYAVGHRLTINVAVGDCFSSDRMYMVDAIATIPCQVPHDFEVFAVMADPTPPGAPYPGIDTIHARVRPECERLYQGYVGVPFGKDAPTAINTFAPEESYWRLDIRTTFCTLRDWNERQLVGSYRAS